MGIIRMKIDKNKLDYANEHPKTKKLSEGQSKKLKLYANNGKVGDKFMEYYNHDLEMGYSPSDAFERAEIRIETMKPSYPVPLKSRN
tara:strand:+ start:470 stop:730 length:261 start_codon:yes stop_codon:yes gene_type:complete